MSAPNPTAALAAKVPVPLHFCGTIRAFLAELKRLQRLP